MGLHIRLIQGSQAATEIVLDRQKRFFRIGRSSDCELVLHQPGLPDVACFFECDFVQNTVSVNCLCPDLIVLNGVPLKQNEQAPWRIGQELRIGANCRLFLEGTAPAKEQNRVSGASLPETSLRKADSNSEAVPRQRQDSTKKRVPRPQEWQKKPDAAEPSAMQVLPDPNEEAVAAIAKKRSQMIQIALIVLCGVGVVAMLMMPKNDANSSSTPNSPDALPIEKMLLRIDDVIKSERIAKNLEDTRKLLNQAYSERSIPKYEEIKKNVLGRLGPTDEKRPYHDTELGKLDQEILDHVNQHIEEWRKQR